MKIKLMFASSLVAIMAVSGAYAIDFNLAGDNSDVVLQGDVTTSNDIDLAGSEGAGKKTGILAVGKSAINTGDYTLTVNANTAGVRNYVFDIVEYGTDFTFTGNLKGYATSQGDVESRGIRLNPMKGAGDTVATFTGKIDIQSVAQQGVAYALDIWAGSMAKFAGELTRLSATAERHAYAVYVGGGKSSVAFDADHTEMIVHADTGESVGIKTWGNSGVIDVNGDMTISATGAGAVMGIYLTGNPGSNETTLNLNADNITLNAFCSDCGGDTYATGLLTSGGSHTTSTSKNLVVNSNSYGIQVQHSSELNLAKGSNTTVNVESKTDGYGVFVTSWNENNPVYLGGHVVADGALTVNVNADKVAYGVVVKNDEKTDTNPDSYSTFVANDLTVSAYGKSGTYALYVMNEMENATDAADVTIGNATLIADGANTDNVYGVYITENAGATFADNVDIVSSGLSIYNDGALDITGGTTTITGDIAGAGALTVSDGAVLNIGTATVVQDSIDFAGGDIHLTLNGVSDYGSLKANSINVGTVTIDKVTSAGKYTILDSENITWDESVAMGRGVGSLYTSSVDGGDVEFTVKSADEIAAGAGVAATTGAAMGAFASSEKFADLNMAVQDVLENNPNAGAVLDAEMAKLNPTGAPVLHAIATQMYNQVTDIAAARLTGDFTVASNVWAQVMYNDAKMGDRFDADTMGFAAGLDTHWNHDIKGGLSFTYNSSDIAVAGRDIDAESMTLALYGRYKPSAWYVSGVVHYTQTEFDETASVLGFGVDSSYKTGTYGAQIAAGYDNVNRFTPEVGLRYMHITADDYDNGIADIKLGDYDFLTAVAGVKYAMNIDLKNGWAIRPQMSLALTYDILADDMDARVVIPGAAAYDVGLGRLARLGREFAWGVAAQWRGLELSVGYDLDVRGTYTSHTGTARFKYEF